MINDTILNDVKMTPKKKEMKELRSHCVDDSIIIIKNIFKDEYRKKLLEDAKPLLIDSEYCAAHYGTEIPGRQTHPTLYVHPKFTAAHKTILWTIKSLTSLNFKVEGSWVNWTNGNRDDINWHNHEGFDYSVVYYIKTLPFFNNGTVFETNKGNAKFIKAPQNSLMLFPASLKHTAPPCPFRSDRYTLAMELNLNDS